jgi:small subunit ribosomal protein S7
MYDGKKSTAESIVYGALGSSRSARRAKRSARAVPGARSTTSASSVEVKSRRVGGATYQVPVEVRPERRQALAIRWLIIRFARDAARTRCASASPTRSSTRPTIAAPREEAEDTHRMAEANKAFAHYRCE